MSQAEPERHPLDRLRRALSLGDATWLVVSSVIGSGIFLAPGVIAERLPHPGLFLAAWLLGGAISLAGAIANAELGAMFPRAGGDYVYLREAFHPLAGFLAGWLTFFAIYAGTIAALAAGFASALTRFVPLGAGGQLTVAVGLVAACSALNFVGVRWGARANNGTAVLKVAVLAGLAVLALALGDGRVENLGPWLAGAGEAWRWGALGLALSPVLFSYLGWNASVYVASEIRAPGRNVPRSLFLGLGICAGVYLAVNLAYLYGLGIDGLRGVANAGEAAGAVLFGEASGAGLALVVLLSILGTLNAMILVGPRIAYAMALDGLFFPGAERAHARFATPGVAIALQGGAAIVLLGLLRTFPNALDYTTFAIMLATIADIAALVRLRRTQPGRPRPYRAWGYPLVPIAYALANAAIAGVLLVGRPRECAIGLIVLASALPFYFAFTRRNAPRAG